MFVLKVLFLRASAGACSGLGAQQINEGIGSLLGLKNVSNLISKYRRVRTITISARIRYMIFVQLNEINFDVVSQYIADGSNYPHSNTCLTNLTLFDPR